MGFYRWCLIFSLMFFSGLSYSDDYFPDGYSYSHGTHLAYNNILPYQRYPLTYINGSVYKFLDGEFGSPDSFVNGYTDKGTYYTGTWLVIDSSVVWAEGLGEFYNYGKEHPEVFSKCHAIKPNFQYKNSDVHYVLVNPDKPEYGTIPALTYDNCTYQVNSNNCPDDDFSPYTICTATMLILYSNQANENNKPLEPGTDDNPSDSGSSGSGDSSDSSSSSGSSGNTGGSSSGGGTGGGAPVPGPVVVNTVPPLIPGDFGVSGGDSSGDSGSSSDSSVSGGVASGGVSGSGGSGGVSGGASGSGGGSGTYPGGNPSGGHTGVSTGATGDDDDDDDGSNFFLPSLDIPELSLAPLWNMWPSARDFTLNLPDAQCPVFNIEVFGRNYRIDAFCTLLTPDVVAVLRLICILAASVFSFVIVLRS